MRTGRDCLEPLLAKAEQHGVKAGEAISVDLTFMHLDQKIQCHTGLATAQELATLLLHTFHSQGEGCLKRFLQVIHGNHEVTGIGKADNRANRRRHGVGNLQRCHRAEKAAEILRRRHEVHVAFGTAFRKVRTALPADVTL